MTTQAGLLVVGGGTGDAGPGAPLKAWTFARGAWTELPGTGPTLRVGMGVAYDIERCKLVLFGGAMPNGPSCNELWEFDAGGWWRP